jgi:glutathione S-transferase
MSHVQPTLIIGTKALSSWSLRPWLLMAHFKVPFDEVLLQFDDAHSPPTQTFKAQIAPLSPTGKVPALHDGGQIIWDSLAICEYVNERYLDGRGWPGDLATRALARAVVAEMHSGFANLRQSMPMDVLREPMALAEINSETQADIRRVCALWRELLGRFGGPFLFGEFSIADCFYAPVATRLHHYAVAVGSLERGYINAIYQLTDMQEWIAQAGTSFAD